MLETTVENKKGILVITPIGRLDGLTSKDFLEATEKQINNEANKVVLNLDRLDYISSEGLRSVLTTAKKTKTFDGQLVISGPKDGVKEVLDISGFGQMLGVFATEEEALKSF
jgi:anti-anti-sigma factor